MALGRVVFGAATFSAARVFQLASNFIAVPFLARILTPTDFGLVALAMSMVVLFTYIGDAGLARSLVRVDPSDTEVWSSAYWAVVLMTVGLALMVLAVAWPAAIFFNEPRLAQIIAVLALAPLFIGLVDIPAASLLQREKFQWLAGAELAASLAGIAVALWLAVLGFGAWALVWQQLALRVVKAAIIFPASGFRPRFVLKFQRLAEHLRFALDTIGWSVMTFVSKQSDTLVVGKVLGAATLGLYNIALRIMQLPINIFGSSVNSALYPRLVKLRDNHPALRQLVLTTTLAQSALVFPPIAAIAAASDAFFKLLLSDRWAGAGEIFTALSVAAALQTVIGLNGSLLQAINMTGARLRLTIEFAVLWAIAAFIASRFGVEAVALTCSLVTIGYMPRLLQLYMYPIGATMMDYLRTLAGPAVVGIAIFIFHRTLIHFMQIDAWPQIGLAVLETLAGWCLLVGLGHREIRTRMKAMREIFAT